MTAVSYTTTDASGNSTSCAFNVVVQDAEAPEVEECPDDIQVGTDPGVCTAVVNYLVEFDDNCDNNLTLTLDEGLNSGAAFPLGTTKVEWIATDDAGNSSVCDFYVTVVDDEQPSLTAPADLTLDCGDINETTDPSAQILDWLALAAATDNCDVEVQVTHDFSPTTLDICAGGTLTVTWTAVDDAGNTTTTAAQITVIPDTEKPSIVVPAPLVLDCGDINETSDPSAQILDWLGAATASDNCDTDPELAYDFDMSQLVICTTEVYTITVTWTATDHCNNTTSKTQTITVIPDTEKPSIVVPAPLVLDCGDINETSDPSAQILDWLASATATDNCDTDPELAYDFDMSQLVICTTATYTITVTWTATDHCNNTTSKTQTITVIPDTEAPVITAPDDITLDCGDINETSDPSAQILDWLASATATDNCDTDPELTYNFNMTDLVICTTATYTIYVTWTATDACNNTTQRGRSITVIPDTEAPVITAPDDITLDCGDINETSDPSAQILDWLASATATDNCDTDPELTYNFNMTDLVICTTATYTIYVTWTATDACNNTTQRGRSITVIPDTEAPVITAPDDITLDCGDINETSDPSAQILDWLASATATDNCDTDPELTYNFNITDLKICTTETYTIYVTWTATDACNNTTQRGRSITVIPDTEKPSITTPAPLILDCGDINETSDPSAQILDWLASATATDNCDTDPELTYDFNMSQLVICTTSTYTIWVTWTATDHCGNVRTKAQPIMVIPDVQKPTLTVPAPLVLDCGDINETSDPSAQILDWLATATATDNCDTDPELTYDFDMSQLVICTTATYTITVTWTAVDHCNNTTSKQQTITVIPDVQKPTLTVPAPLVLDCGDINETSDPSAQVLDWLATATATDNCDTDPELTYDFDMSQLVICTTATYTITVTWTAVDHCNNSTTKAQTITVIPDTEKPSITVPAPLVLDCGDINETSDPSAQVLDWLATATATDNCDTDPELTYDFDMSQLVICTTATYTITVTWTANDACNNTTQKTQTITVIPDIQKPTLTVPAPLVLDCGDINETSDPSAQILDWLASATATDNCDTDPELTYDFNMSQLVICTTATYTITVTWTAVDHCNNSTTKAQTITVIPDVQKPTLTVPAPLVLDCGDINETSDPSAQILDWLASATATDNCDTDPELTYDFDMSQLVICTTATYTITVTWTAVDHCNNSTTKAQTITVIPDTEKPVIVAPDHLVLDCGDINETTDPSAQILDWLASATVTDNCDTDPVLTYNFNITDLNICAPATYTIWVTWTATDHCGNSTERARSITVIPDTEAPVIVAPDHLTLDCGDINETTDPSAQILDWLASATVTDNCDTDPVLTYNFNITDLNICAPATYTIWVTWTATDHCGNSTERARSITVIPDTEAPVIVAPDHLTLDCGDINETTDPSAQILDWLASATVTDNCDTDPVLTYNFNITDLNICAPATYTIWVTWTATDHCGNSTERARSITVVPDTEKPSITVPAPLVLDCGDINETSDPAAQIDAWLATASATDNCDTDPELSHSFDISELNICAPATYTITVTWTANDACNNNTTKTQTITVIPDTEKPSIAVPAPLVLDCGDINETSDPAAQIDAWLATATATDNCDTDPELSHSFDISELNICAPATYTITVTWTANDACNNNTTKTQTITVIPDTEKPSIHGTGPAGAGLRRPERDGRPGCSNRRLAGFGIGHGQLRYRSGTEPLVRYFRVEHLRSGDVHDHGDVDGERRVQQHDDEDADDHGDPGHGKTVDCGTGSAGAGLRRYQRDERSGGANRRLAGHSFGHGQLRHRSGIEPLVRYFRIEHLRSGDVHHHGDVDGERRLQQQHDEDADDHGDPGYGKTVDHGTGIRWCWIAATSARRAIRRRKSTPGWPQLLPRTTAIPIRN
ncbi:MAG: HYR domain-containing protein [Saprospirales bacterium]|nr:HYR domain-containing protein [Saprospirales bacterium]